MVDAISASSVIGAVNNVNNEDDTEHETTQTEIISELLRQQPTIVQAQVSGVSGTPTTVTTTPAQELMPVAPQNQIDYGQLFSTMQALANPLNTALSTLMLGGESTVAPAAAATAAAPVTEEEPVASSSTSPVSNGPEYKPRNVREKIYADGYIMSFDKQSCCGKKYFWRCERKNDCTARLHTDIKSRRIIRKLHPHTHRKPTPDELAFYEQDLDNLPPNYAYPVKSINRSYMQRKLSRAKQQAAAQITSAPLTSGPAAAATSPPPNQGEHSGLPAAAVKEEPPESIEELAQLMMRQADFQNTFRLTQKIVELIKPKNEIGVQWKGSDEALLMFLSHDSGAEENVFFPVVALKKDEKSLITALEGFTGKRCEGGVVMAFSEKVNVHLHEALINNWTHGKLFLVNTDTPSMWRLTPVDAYGRVLNAM